MPKSRFTPPGICPVCDKDVPRNARACLGCGADERSGWHEDAHPRDALNLPGNGNGAESFNYDRLISAEFGFGNPRSAHVRPLWWLVGVELLVLLALGYVTGLWS